MSGPSTFWLTDRTHYEMGAGRCARERYLAKHFGSAGYGIVRKGESVPLITGTYVHEIAEALFNHLLTTDTLPPRMVVRAAIAKAQASYLKKIEARGFAGILRTESSDLIVREQQTLIAGLAWVLDRYVLPWWHQLYKTLRVETEGLYILECSCGLGTGVLSAVEHQAKGCTGIALQIRQDVIGERREDQRLAYAELKTTGRDGQTFAEQWEGKPQLGLGGLNMPEIFGRPLSECYVIGLNKGYRKRIKDETGKTTGRRQESPLCYGYRAPGNPPVSTDEWKPAYEWVDAAGKTRRVTREYQKAGLWELATTDWPDALRGFAANPGLQPEELWVELLPEDVLRKQVFLIGPMPYPEQQTRILCRQLVGEEHHWQEIAWKLYEEALTLEGGFWATENFQALLDELVPASWDCNRFGESYRCQFWMICHREPGWEDPLGSGKYIARRPHHSAELEQAVARGLLPEQADEAEEED